MSQWPVDPAFVAQLGQWLARPDKTLLGLIWTAYDRLVEDQPAIDRRDLERCITQLLEPRVREAMTGYEPFYVQHGTFERETMAPTPAQPPEYDLAFVWRADERVIWPLEAKVLETPGGLAEYSRDLSQNFLTCRYAPCTASGAMVAYLLTGATEEVFRRIAEKVGTPLDKVAEADGRPQRISRHRRTVPMGKTYPVDFDCYHLVLEFPALRRARPSHRAD